MKELLKLAFIWWSC